MMNYEFAFETSAAGHVRANGALIAQAPGQGEHKSNVLLSCNSQHNASSCLAEPEVNGDGGFYPDRLPVEEEWLYLRVFHRFDCSRSQQRVTAYDLQVLNHAFLVDKRR